MGECGGRVKSGGRVEGGRVVGEGRVVRGLRKNVWGKGGEGSQ